MSDETKTNLEPIDEGEVNLKEKFIGGVSPEKTADKSVPGKEVVIAPESIVEKTERKEGAAEKEDAYARIMAKAASQRITVTDDEVAGDAKKANQGMDAESKINNLVNLAETKSVAHAVNVARHMEDNYILDEFHDRLLADELHNALIKKGLIKEV
jgi:hypothetical protein